MGRRQRNMAAQYMGECVFHIDCWHSVTKQQGTGDICCSAVIMPARIKQQNIAIGKPAVGTGNGTIMDNGTIWPGTGNGGKAWHQKFRMISAELFKFFGNLAFGIVGRPDRLKPMQKPDHGHAIMPMRAVKPIDFRLVFPRLHDRYRAIFLDHVSITCGNHAGQCFWQAGRLNKQTLASQRGQQAGEVGQRCDVYCLADDRCQPFAIAKQR